MEWAGNNYSAYLSDLSGATLEETESNTREAVELYIDTLREDGKPIPEPTTKAGPITVAA